MLVKASSKVKLVHFAQAIQLSHQAHVLAADRDIGKKFERATDIPLQESSSATTRFK
jgi:hypothetical protein